GVRSNAIAPAARTRMTEATPGLGDIVKAEVPAGKFDMWDPANISPLVAYLSTADCPLTGKTFFVQGSKVTQMNNWAMGQSFDANDRWTIDGLASELKPLA
ncbi:MAG: short-chain dehydrogenase, partial [Acidimicrobiales bacterium]|nr:short-chain dehydrogenase [Acidimicrobiales bacterium]